MSFVTGLSVSCELLKKGVEVVITEGGFSSTVLQTAKQLSKWMASPDNGNATAVSSQKLVMSLEEYIWNHPMNRFGRTKIFGAFHQLRSSQAFKSEWANFCRKVPPLTQIQPSISMVLVRFLMKSLNNTAPIVQPTSGVTSQKELSLSYEEQSRLLRSAIGNFPGENVTCPVISNISLTECPDEASTMPWANTTYERMRALVTTPILPRGWR